MISTVEAEAQRKITEAFIEADVQEVILVPHERVSDGSGGFTISPLPARRSARGRVVPVGSGMATSGGERLSLDGRSFPVTFVLIMKYDAEVDQGDRFTARDHELEVAHIQEKRDYQTKAELITVGLTA